MTTSPIIESGMIFGPYPEGQCFYIEKSACYTGIQEYVQIAEFILLRSANGKPALWIVEAKSGTPRPTTQPNFDCFIAEIREKLVNTFSLGLACCLGRHESAEADLPSAFKALNLKDFDVKFVLVIHGHHDAWLPPIKDALAKALRVTIKTWVFTPTSVVVLNEGLARKHGLIRPESEAGA